MGGSRIRGNGDGRYAATLHPATAYEDFVEGLRPGRQSTSKDESSTAKHEIDKPRVGPPKPDPKAEGGVTFDVRKFYFEESASVAGDGGTFTLHDGFFVSICIEAAKNPTREFAVLLDELNRCNIPKVMGDLVLPRTPSDPARAFPAPSA